MTKLARSRVSLSVGGALLLASAVLIAAAAWGPNDKKPEKQNEKAEQDSNVKLKNVVMFNAGVSYFEHRATVAGDAQLKLKFPPEKINDVLKSLIVRDAKGTAGLVTYESKTPVAAILDTFAIDLSENLTLADLLRQVRGERVVVEAPQPIEGTILSVTTDKRKVKVDDDEELLVVEILNLRTDKGLKSVPMESISSIRLLDERLNEELQKALEVLARGHDTNEKTVTINFRGEAERPVGVGYVQPTPVWKMSYRLSLQDDQPDRLQGWAIVENTTEQDWENVDLTLVSGRPVSFVMDLYQSLFVDRPHVELSLYANLRPQVYEQGMGMGGMGRMNQKGQGQAGEAAKAPAPAAARLRAKKSARGPGFAFGAPAAADAARRAEKQVQLGALLAGVKAMARGGEVGELFQYQIDVPVTLERHQSAMLPVINGEVKGEKYSIYDQSVQAKHPMNGLKLTNSTDLYLMEGPITVFDDGVYAGEALIEDLAPGQDRLISYALDLDVEVSPETKSEPQHLLSVKIDHGTLISRYKLLREHDYTVKNSADEPQKVLIQYPKDPNWELTAPEEPEETTRDAYRFLVTPKAGETVKLAVKEQRVIAQQVALTNLPIDGILVYVNSEVISDEAKAALQEVVERKQEIDQKTTRLNQLKQELNEIAQEQERIRQNMSRLNRNEPLYQRYVKKFGTQEDRIEKIHVETDELEAEITKLREALDEYLSGLEIE